MGITLDELMPLYVLDRVRGFGPQKHKQLFESGIAVSEVLDDPTRLPMQGKRAEGFVNQIRTIPDTIRVECLEIAKRQIFAAYRHGGASSLIGATTIHGTSTRATTP